MSATLQASADSVLGRFRAAMAGIDAPEAHAMAERLCGLLVEMAREHQTACRLAEEANASLLEILDRSTARAVPSGAMTSEPDLDAVLLDIATDATDLMRGEERGSWAYAKAVGLQAAVDRIRMRLRPASTAPEEPPVCDSVKYGRRCVLPSGHDGNHNAPNEYSTHGWHVWQNDTRPAAQAVTPETERKRYVAGFAITGDLRYVMLLRKERPEWQAGRLNGFGGKVEPGESYPEAMAREGFEESGIDFEWEHFVTLQCNDERHSGEIAFFRAIAAEATLRHLHHRQNDAGERFEMHALGNIWNNERVIPNLRWLVPMAAAENDRHDWPYLVSEKGAVPSGAMTSEPPASTAPETTGDEP